MVLHLLHQIEFHIITQLRIQPAVQQDLPQELPGGQLILTGFFNGVIGLQQRHDLVHNVQTASTTMVMGR